MERTDQANELTMAETDTTTQPYRDCCLPRSGFELIGYLYNTGSKLM